MSQGPIDSADEASSGAAGSATSSAAGSGLNGSGANGGGANGSGLNGSGVGSRETDPEPTRDYPGRAGPSAISTLGEHGTNGARATDTTPVDRSGGAKRAVREPLPAVPGYELLAWLGKGGMGVVYKARDLRLRRLVALKMIKPDHAHGPTRAELDRFVDEARIIAQFHHEHLVRIHEIGTHEGKPYFSLEYLEGGTLHRRMDGAPQPPAEAAALIETVARAVHYAHGHKIVHRDLKPANILFTADGVAKVTDFGLAKQMDEDTGRTEQGGILGTASYMAPEQAWGHSKHVGPAADIYALGAIFYEALTGRPPFHGADKWQTLELVRSAEPVSPRRLVPAVPRDLELICLRCLNKDPRQRFASAEELAEDLRRYREGRPIHTRPTPVWERAWKWSRRQPAAASLLAVTVLAVLALVLYLDQRVGAVRRELREEQRTTEMRVQVKGLQVQAEEAVKQGRLADAQADVKAALEMVRAEPVLADLEPGLTGLEGELARRREADARFAELLRLKGEALFHGTIFVGVDVAVNAQATRSACEKALALFHIAADGAAAGNDPVFPQFMAPQRRSLCAEACYELLLLWADAEAQPVPGQDLDRSLRLLQRAARLPLAGAASTRAIHLRRAAVLQAQGKPLEAQEQLELAARTEPRGALDHFLIGEAHQKQGRPAEAAAAFAEALRIDAGHFWARYFLAVCNLQLQRSGQARDNLTACVAARPDFLWLYVLRGVASTQLCAFRAAEEDFLRALELKPEPQAVYGIRVNQGALRLREARWLHDACAVVPPALHEALPGLGGAVAATTEARRLDAAAHHLEAARDLQPNQYPAYRYLALVRQQQRRLDEAAGLLDRAIDLAARQRQAPAVQAQLHRQRGGVLRERGDLDAALRDLEQAAQLAGSADDLAECGRLLLATNQPADALKRYDEALARRPDLAEAYHGKARALRALGGRDDEAAAALDQFIARGGRPGADWYRFRGTVHAQRKQLTDALAAYTEALRLQADAATLVARGWTLLAADVPRLALDDFEEAIRRDSTSADAYAGRGLIRARLGEHEKALADAEAVLRAGSESFVHRWNVAHIYAQLAGRLAADPAARELRSQYQNEAIRLLREGFQQLQPAEWQAHWRDFIATDALLRPLHGNTAFKRLEQEIAR